jgi:hypothetical protein
MTAIVTRSSVLAVKVESTEGTPVVPSASTDFIAIQDGLSMTPNFNQLENAELRSSIGAAKSIQGLEQPTGGLPHYIRHSGVEGTAPNYSPFIKAAFGALQTNGTEYDTVSGSTTTVVKVNTGEGASFRVGQALLLKDGTNGYEIRPIHSISGDDLTLGFKLANAPGTGVNLGKCVGYYPASSGHDSLTVWRYIGNSGAIDMIAGAKVTGFSFSASAGELINGQIDFEGVKYFYDPIIILAADTKLDFLDNVTTRAATVTAKVYRDPHELAQALQDSMNSQGSANTFVVAYNDAGASAGKFTISSNGSTLSLLWNTGTNAANTIGDKIGFSTAADDTGALTYTSDNVQSWASSITPTYDSADPLAAKSNSVFIGDVADNVCFESSSVNFALSNTRTQQTSVCSESGVSGSLITGRTATVDLVAYIVQHDVEKYKNYRANDTIRFMYNFGTKSGGNWVAGKSACLYLPSATISSIEVADQDGLAVLNLTVTAFVPSDGSGEVFLNFL